jgi:hypothetical protein
MSTKEKSDIQELITTLYLRLNGYLTTGFIFQSSEEKIAGEVDMVAVRFPLHRQDETEHNTSEFLEPTNDIDVILGEVKSNGMRLQFNNSIRSKQNIEKLLKWVGLFDDDTLSKLADEIVNMVIPKQNSNRKNLLATSTLTSFGQVRIRPILFSPERVDLNNADKFVNWKEINDFLWTCLCPPEKRMECGTRYDFNAWGHGLNEIVKFYKTRQKTNQKPESINEIYSAFEKHLAAKSVEAKD